MIDTPSLSINDQSMTFYEYDQAVKRLARFEDNDPSEKREKLSLFIESMIAVKGHAWCMDVKAERRKMTRLFMTILEEIEPLQGS